MSKILVAYFSPTGHTERIAKRIAAAAYADLFKIEPAQPYSAEDMTWGDETSRSFAEMSDEACRPELAAKAENIEDYDMVFLGFPVWWSVEPRIIDTFLEAHDLAGKRIVPFATSDISGIGDAPAHMQKVCPEADVMEGQRFNLSESDATLFQWLAPLTR